MANKLYVIPESPVTFSTTGTILFTPTSLANGAGRISSQLDLGVSAHARKFVWRARTKLASAPAVGVTLRIYLLVGIDTSYVEGMLGGVDAAFTAEDSMRNGTPLWPIETEYASATPFFVKTGRVDVSSRIVQIAWWNATGVALSATATDHEFSLTPVPDELQ